MDTKKELDDIRAELMRVQDTVTHLVRRLEDVEAATGGEGPTPEALTPPVILESRSITPLAPASGPPPLPRAAEVPVKSTTTPAEEAPAPPAEEAPAPSAPKPVIARAQPPKRPLVPPVEKKPRAFGPPEGMGWEMALTTWWLPRIGILMLALGTVWGFTYISGQFSDAAWMPWARVGLGYGLAAGLGALGWKLEKKYPGYARILLGGGFGLLYFVTFATWYIPQTRIAPSQEFTLLLLALLVAAWGAAAQWRRSQPIALTMTLLGHFTVALSTLSLEAPSRAAVGGLLILGIGSAFFLIRNGWYLVALSAMVGSYLNQFFWLAQAPASGRPIDFALGMAVLATYLVLYALADRLTPQRLALGHGRLRNLYCGLNTGGFLALGYLLMQGFDFAAGREHLLYFATALFAAGLGWSYTTRRIYAEDHHRPAWVLGGEVRADGDPAPDALCNIYFTKASMLATAGIAAWLDGPTVTLSIALQALALLAAAGRTQRPVGRLLALATGLVAFVHGLYVLDLGGLPAPGTEGHMGHMLVALMVTAVFWATAEVYRRTPWHTYPEGLWGGPEWLRDIAGTLELLEQIPSKPIRASRMALAHGFVAGGALLLAGYVDALLPSHLSGPALCLLGLVSSGIGLGLASGPLLSGSAFFLALGFVWQVGAPTGPDFDPAGLAAACVLSLLLASELLRRFLFTRLADFDLDGGIQGAWRRNHSLAACLCAVGGALIVIDALHNQATVETSLLLVGLMGLGATGYAALAGSANLGLFAIVLALYSVLPALNVGEHTTEWPRALLGALLIALGATAVESRYWGEKRPGLAFHRLLPVPYLLYGVTAWNLVWLADDWLAINHLSLALTALAALFAIGSLALHARALSALAAVLLGLAMVAWIESDTTLIASWRVGGIALLLAGLAGDRFLTRFNPYPRPWPARLMLLWVWLTALTWLDERLEGGWFLAGVAALGLAFLAYAGLFRTRTGGALAAFAGVMATLPLLLGTAGPMAPAEVWAAHGVVILFWLAAERGLSLLLDRLAIRQSPAGLRALAITVAGTPALLGILGLTRIETIQNFYLTMAWTAWGLALFGWAVFTRQPWFRYAGLAVFALSLSRAFLIDVWRLEGLYRVGAMLFLGVALLAVAFGYTRWRATQGEKDVDTKEEKT